MKNILTFILLTISVSSFGQTTQKDSATLEFIKSKKNFVLLTDTVNLSPIVKPYYKIIADYLSMCKMEINDYYVYTNNIQSSDSILSIPIYNYYGFKKLKDLEDKDKAANKKRKEGEYIMVTDIDGNVSGKDGNLEIDMRLKRIIRFSLWQ